MSKKAIYGGAFDPVTNAHLEICRIANSACGVNVVLMPCYNHTFGKKPTDPTHRLKMLSLIESDFISVNDMEIKTKSKGSTFETLTKLSKNGDEYSLIIGLDNAQRINEWVSGKDLIEKFEIIVFSRPGYKGKEDWFLKKPHKFIEFEMDLSSTMVRTALKSRNYDLASTMVPDSVFNYIKQNNLYL